MRYESMVALRYLRAKRSEAFISLITMISIVGVMIGVMTLNIVLAVMTGFEEDLRDRILGFNPHIVLVSYAGTIPNPDEVVQQGQGHAGRRGGGAARLQPGDAEQWPERVGRGRARRAGRAWKRPSST